MKELLLITILLPLAGALLIGCLAPLGRSVVRMTALTVTLLTLVSAARVLYEFPAEGVTSDFAVTDIPWLGESVPWLDIRFSVGLDGLGLWMFGLSALLMVTCVLVSWESIEDRAPLFYSMLLLLEFGCLGVFSARDIILFYLFFEFTLIPLFFLIGIWGSEDRRYAAVKFFLFTLAGSVITFLGLLTIVWWDFRQQGGDVLRFSIAGLTQTLAEHPLPHTWQLIVFGALFAGFAIKVPLFPLHTWLPLAHTQAPAAGSIVLAGVLLKIGVYGFLRFNVPMLPEATVFFMPWMLTLSVIGIIYGALVALAQTDMKRLVAYSSVSHLGYCMLGLFALNPLGVQGSVLQMVNHGVSTGALFAIIGMIYERYHTRAIAEYSGIARTMPWMAFFMVVFTFSSIGLPGLNGFAGEFMILLGTFQRAWADAPPLMRMQLMAVAVVAVSGVILGAWYMLWLVQRVFFGPLKTPAGHGHATEAHPAAGDHAHAAHADHGHNDHGHGGHGDDDRVPVGPSMDMNWREILALAPLAVLALWIGLRPHDFLSRMEPTLNRATQAAMARLDATTSSSSATAGVESKLHAPTTVPATEKLTRVR
jgi:NADH-quinone oxidoreductase subunit M